MTITPAQRQAVYDRAGGCCEYCRLPAQAGTITFHVDHIIPVKHDGSDEANNLCLACYKCNAHKGPNISGYDPETKALTPLYNPREQAWDAHSVIQDDFQIAGITAIGRTTAQVLQMNDVDRVETRRLLADIGEYPCGE